MDYRVLGAAELVLGAVLLIGARRIAFSFPYWLAESPGCGLGAAVVLGLMLAIVGAGACLWLATQEYWWNYYLLLPAMLLAGLFILIAPRKFLHESLVARARVMQESESFERRARIGLLLAGALLLLIGGLTLENGRSGLSGW